MRGRRNALDPGGDGHGDLQITPLLDLFVALIPFLIVSVALTKVHIVDVGISRPVASATSTPDKNPFDLQVKVKAQSADITLNGKLLASAPVGSDPASLEKLHSVLVDLKKKHPDQYRIRIEPEGKVTLQTMMLVMDAARKLAPTDGDIFKKDENGQPVKLQYLFPNVILRGVYGS